MGHNLQDLICALFESAVANTTSVDLRNTIAQSVRTLGSKQTGIYLNAVHSFLLQRGNKLSENEKAFIFATLASVLADRKTLDECDEQQILLLINLCTQEMSMAKDIDNGLASASKDVLVTLAGKPGGFVNQVMDCLLHKFQPGSSSPPHRFIVYTMAEIAQKNACGFMPFLHDILARVDALLPHIKNEKIRGVFCQSICAFAESVNEFATTCGPNECAMEVHEENHGRVSRTQSEQETEADSVRDDFSDQFETAYEIVLGWTSASKDIKCRTDAAECVGMLCLMINRDRIVKDLKKLDSIFRYLHKKASVPEEQLAVVKGIANFLRATCPDESVPVEHYINDFFEMLFPHVCLLPDQALEKDISSPQDAVTIKIKNEAFHCFQASSCRSADKEIYFLLHKMQSPHEHIKLGAISLLRHLLNSADEQMKENSSLITMGLKPFLTDELISVRVKMSLCKLCVALVDNQYVQVDEAGHQVMQFLLNNLIKRTSLQQTQSTENGSGSLSNQLNTQCAQALSTISNTSNLSLELLWPLLFEYVCIEQYYPVLSDIFKCLRILCTRTRQAGRDLDFSRFPDNSRLPGPLQMMCRLLVSLNGPPLSPALNARATESLRLFGELAEWFHKKFANNPIVQKHTTKLASMLEDNSFVFLPGEFNQTKAFKQTAAIFDYSTMEQKSARVHRWQAAVLDLLCAVIEEIDEQEWREALAAVAAKQLSLYSSAGQPDSQQSTHDKAFLMRCLGCTLARIQSPEFVKEYLFLLFRQTNHSITSERTGCAMAVGHSASILDHTDWVLTELENVSKWEHMREKKAGGGGSSSGIFSYIKDSLPYGRSSDPEIQNLKATIILSYGYIVFYCPPEGLILRLHKTILHFLRQYTANIKEVLLREAHLETLNLIAISVHPGRIRDYKFESRYECLGYVKEYVNDEKSPETLSSWIRLLAAKATASFVLLEPLSENEFVDITGVLIGNVFPISRERSGLKTIDDDEAATVMEATVVQCRNAIGNMVRMNPFVDPTITKLLKLLYQYYGSERDHERARAIDFTVLILHLYSERAADCTLGVAKEFVPLSGLLGRLSPRLCDSLASVRLLSLKAIWLSFKLSLLHRGLSPLDKDLLDSSLFGVPQFIETYFGGAQEGRLDSNKCRAVIMAISKEIEKHLPQSQVQTYITSLFKMFSDRQNNVSSSAAQLLSCIISDRSHSLSQEAEILFLNMIDQLIEARPSKIQTYTELLNGFTIFSAHYQNQAVQILLRQSLPYNQTISEVWEMIARDQFLNVIEHLLELIRSNTLLSSNQLTMNQLSPAPNELTDLAVDGTAEGDKSISPAQTTKQRSSSQSAAFLHPHFELIDLGGGMVTKVVSNEACALISALAQLIEKGEPEAELLKKVPSSIAALLQMLAALVDCQYSNAQKHAVAEGTAATAAATGAAKKTKKAPSHSIVTAELTRVTTVPVNLVAEAIKTLLLRIKAENVIDRMNSERAWTNILSPQHFTTAISSFCCALFDFRPNFIGPLMSIEVERLATEPSNCAAEAERISAAAVLSALITRSPHTDGKFSLELFCSAFQTLEKALRDPNLTVRRLAIHGLGCIGQLRGSGADELILRFSQRSIEAALAGLDDCADRQDQLGMEAIDALNNLVDVAQPPLLTGIMSHILLKIRPCFDKENANIRASAFSLFGGLGTIVGDYEPYKENIHCNMVCALLHLNDEEECVRNACVKALRICIPLMNSDHASALIESELTGADKKPTSNYANFVQQFGMILTLSFPDRLNNYALDCNNYFRSMSPRIRSNAAMLMGYLLTALTPELRATLSKDLIFSGLIQLLNDSDEQVRLQTVSTISLLHTFN